MKKLMLALGICSFALVVFAETKIVAPVVKPATVKKPVTAVPKKPVVAPAVKPAVTPAGQFKIIDKDVIGVEVYVCAKHKIESPKPGKCPRCKEAFVRKTSSLTWKCMKCGMTSDKEGMCPADKIKMRKCEVLYRCVPDNIAEGEPGKCPKCGQTLKKVVNPMK